MNSLLFPFSKGMVEEMKVNFEDNMKKYDQEKDLLRSTLKEFQRELKLSNEK